MLAQEMLDSEPEKRYNQAEVEYVVHVVFGRTKCFIYKDLHEAYTLYSDTTMALG